MLTRSVSSLERKKSKNNLAVIDHLAIDPSLLLGYSYSSSLITESPGSIAAGRREQMALQNAQRKLKIAHYGRSKSAKFVSKVSPLVESLGNVKTSETSVLQRRCTSVTPNSGNFSSPSSPFSCFVGFVIVFFFFSFFSFITPFLQGFEFF